MPTDSDPYSMMNQITLGFSGSLVLVAVLILFNAFFAMAEIALVSVRKTRIKQLIDEGVRQARTVQRLMEDPTKFLATIQIGMTMLQFFASAVGAITLAKPLAALFERTNISVISESALLLAVVVVTLIIGFLSIVVGEISPKSLALRHAEKIALSVSRPIMMVSIITAPFLKLVTWASNLVLYPFGGTASFSPPILTEEELKMLVEAGEEEGVLEEEEKEMIHSIFEFTDTVVRKVMVPRIDIKAVDVNASVDELLEMIIRAGHSRIPVYEESIDSIVGVIHAKDLLYVLHEDNRQIDIRDLMRPPYIIPENKKVDELLAEFRNSKIQMAIIVDEYGGTAGLVTVEDLLEEIVGDIMDEYDVEEPMIVVVDERTTIVDARAPVDEINEQMELSLPEEEFDTIGGFVFGVLGRQPQEGERIEYDGVALIIDKIDGSRIQKIRIEKIDRPAGRHEHMDTDEE